MKILGIDYGGSRIGLAMSDPLEIIASPLEVVKNDGNHLMRITGVAAAGGVKTAVVGLPVNMDGTEGEKAAEVRRFADELQKVSSLEIVFSDERLTTVRAREILAESKVDIRKRNKLVDMLSAQIILQGYLDKQK